MTFTPYDGLGWSSVFRSLQLAPHCSVVFGFAWNGHQIIPHDFGFRKMREFIINDPATLKKKIEMVEVRRTDTTQSKPQITSG